MHGHNKATTRRVYWNIWAQTLVVKKKHAESFPCFTVSAAASQSELLSFVITHILSGHFVRYTCKFMQISGLPIMWQQVSALKHAHMIRRFSCFYRPNIRMWKKCRLHGSGMRVHRGGKSTKAQLENWTSDKWTNATWSEGGVSL